MDEPKVERALILHDGDRVVLECQRPISLVEAGQLRETWEKQFKGIPMVVLCDGIHVAREVVE